MEIYGGCVWGMFGGVSNSNMKSVIGYLVTFLETP